MCLGIPGKVIEICEDGVLPTGIVDFGGIRKDACLVYASDAAVGDYVIVHAGFAISRVDEAEARRTLEVLRAMGDLVAAEIGESLP